MKKLIRVISFILCLALTLCSCSNGVMLSLTPPNGNGFWAEYEAPDINISEIGKPTDKENINESLQGSETVYDLVFENVAYTLSDVGFTVQNAMAINYDDNEGVSAVGLMYYRTDIPVFSDESYQGTGFYEIVDEGEDTTQLETVNTLYVKNLSEPEDATTYLAAYDYQDIGYDHFVYNNKYVIYYQESDNVIRYLEKENLKENYALSLGSLFDFDNGKYIYDASIFDEYQEHSGSSLLSQQDYARLKAELEELAEKQLQAGYRVEEYNIVFISPESIQTYLESDEKDTFFGYSVDDLTATMGVGTAITYTENGFEKAQILASDAYNWKSFLTKVGVGCGIILVGAVLTPITGGASFSCALFTICKITVGASLVSGLGTLAIETAVGLSEGKSFEDALKEASHKGLDSFANTFVITAAVSSIGVASGLIKPTACFIAGTPIATVGADNTITYTPIENIVHGAKVYSYNEKTGLVSVNQVTEVFAKQVYETVELIVDDERIVTTYEHPFYLPQQSGWKPAGKLNIGDAVLTLDSEIAYIESVSVETLEEPVIVYNFTVKNDHTYFVGHNLILVHNSCDDIFRKAGNNAGKQAKADALDDIVSGRNYKKWGLNPKNADDLEVIKYVQKYKTFKGSGCEFAHAVDVNAIKQACKSGKITMEQALKFCSNPQNGILTSNNTHRLIIHAGNTNNPSNLAVVLKARPSIRPTVEMILQALGQAA